MKILVTNDDGVASPGLWALAESLRPVGDVVVVAPDREQSGVGSSVTLHHPVRIASAVPLHDGIEAYAIEGTPGDSVILATETLVKGPIDLLVSGINAGSNLGNDVFVSGTVGAAFHGYFRGIPSIALSITALNDLHFDVAARLAFLLASHVREGALPKKLLMNVNVPNKPLDQLKGVQATRLANGSYSEVVNEGKDPRRKYYWINRTRPTWTLEAGTDIWAVQNDYISITPLDNDVTAHSILPCMDELKLAMEDGLREGSPPEGPSPGS